MVHILHPRFASGVIKVDGSSAALRQFAPTFFLTIFRKIVVHILPLATLEVLREGYSPRNAVEWDDGSSASQFVPSVYHMAVNGQAAGPYDIIMHYADGCRQTSHRYQLGIESRNRCLESC